MGKKLKEESGLTLVELLVVTAIFVVLSLMLGTGLQMALSTYDTMVAQSEVELLLSTALDTLTDDLRYALNVKMSNDLNVPFIYDSDSYGDGTQLMLVDGKIMAQVVDVKKRVLSSGVYGSNTHYKDYQVLDMQITYKNPTANEVTFNIVLKVGTADGKITASTPGGGVTIRCLNPA